MRLDYSMEVACPPEKLWPYLDQPDLQKQWMKGLEEIKVTSEGPKRAGSKFRMRIKEGGKTAEHEGQVTAYERNRHLGIRFWGGSFQEGMVMNVDYRLADLNGRTRLDYWCKLDFPPQGFLMRLFMPVGVFFARMQLRGFMKKLKSLVESSV